MKLSNYPKIFKALSNEQRLKIFMIIYEQSLKGSKGESVFPVKKSICCPIEKAFTKVCECMNLSRSTISHHFKELQNAGLITCERDGQMYRCRINEEVVNSIKGKKLNVFKPIIISGIGYFLFNLFTFNAYVFGGEVGRVDAINNSQVFLIILFEYFILKHLESVKRKVVTAIIAFSGVFILGFY